MQVVLPDWLDVSRETLQGLIEFESFVRKWNPTVNLVAKGSLDQIWDRHILDSAQLWPLCQGWEWGSWLDLGSGGGFPGLVLAILSKGAGHPASFTLVESDRRKSVFLSEAARHLDLSVTVISKRIDAIEPIGANVLSARALAPLVDLCAFAVRHLRPDGVALFPKGRGAEAEVAQASERFHFSIQRHQSKTQDDAAILEMRGIRRV